LVQIWTPHAPAAGTGAPQIGSRPAIAGGATADATLERRAMAEEGPPPSRRETFLAFAPYLIIIVVLGVTSISGITKELDTVTSKFTWPGLHVLNSKGKAPSSEEFKLNWLTAAGTWLLVSGLLTALVLRVRPGFAVRTYVDTVVKLRWAIVTVMAVLALAYVM